MDRSPLSQIPEGYNSLGNKIETLDKTVEKKEGRSFGEILTAIEQKITSGKPLAREELFVLYQKNEDPEALKYAAAQTLGKLRERRTDDEIDFDFCVMFNCLPDELAHNKEEITENTKVYIGGLYPNFFKQKNLPDIVYDKYPGGFIKIDKATSGGLDKSQLLNKLNDGEVRIRDTALQIIESSSFKTSKVVKPVDFVCLRVVDLFPLNDDKHTYDEICYAAKKLGLALCKIEDAPNYCLNSDQSFKANLGVHANFATTQVKLDDESHATKILSVGIDGNGKYILDDEEIFDISQFRTYEKFTFRASN
jgi:hypothetical protein